MVCYARPASRFAAIAIVAFLVFSRPLSHFLNTAAIAVAVAAATGGAAVAAALVFAAFLSTRRRRAAAGGCVSCQFRCQHAMTEQPRIRASRTGPSRRLWLVTTADRRQPGPAHLRPGPAAAHPAAHLAAPGRPAPVFLAMPSVAPARAGGACGVAGPRWPDRPVHRAGPAPRERERAGAPA